MEQLDKVSCKSELIWQLVNFNPLVCTVNTWGRGCLAGLMQQKICLPVDIFLLSIMLMTISTWFHVVLTMLDSAHYFASLLGVRAPNAAGVPGRHLYLTMSGYPLNVPALKYWYLVPLTKVLWAASLHPSDSLRCTKSIYGLKKFPGPKDGPGPQKISHLHAHSLTDLPSKMCVIYIHTWRCR